MAIFNLYTRKYPAIRKPRLLLTINCKFAVDFFARGLHTRTAVARLPLRQLGFLFLHVTTSKTFLQMFYFSCNHLLALTCLQHAKTFAKMFCKMFYNIFANVLFYM